MKRSIALLLALGGCMLPKEPVLPPVDICEDWKSPVEAKYQLKNDWWTLFEDPCLDNLMERALAGSPDLWVACERIQEARALEGIAFSYRLPDITLTPTWEKTGVLFATESVAEPELLGRAIQPYYRFPFNMQYEADFWGKFCYADRAAQERLIASEFGYLSVVNILTTDVARVYLQLRTLDEEIVYFQQAVAFRRSLVEINEKRVAAHLDPEMDLERAKLDLAAAETELLDAQRLREISENELGALLGESASCFSIPPGVLPAVKVVVEPGLPSELLLRRPDLNEQHRIIRAALFEIGVANANFFPSFPLTGSLGFVSPFMAEWFTWQSRFWSFAFNGVQQLFTGGRLTNEKRLAFAHFRQHQGIYQQKVYRAFKEVEDALSDNHYREEQYASQEKAVHHAKETSRLAHQLFDAGLLNYLQVANTDRIELETSRYAIRLKGARYLAAVALIKALGGAPSC